LDSRNGYLGKEQARWLKESLRKSAAQYKLIFTGKSFGLQFLNQRTQDTPLAEKEQRNNGEEDESDQQDVPPSGDADEEGDENEEATPPTEDSEQKEKTATSSSRKTTVSSSRQKALEATKEEFDEDGLGKTTLQHVIIHNYRKQYPEGYPLPEGEGHGEAEKLESERLDDNSSYTNPHRPQILLDSSRDAADDERGLLGGGRGEEEGDVLTDHEAQSETLSQCFNATSLLLVGGIIIFSSTQATDSYLATYSFSETEPPMPSSLQVSTQLAAYCLEVGIGLGPGGDEQMRCVASSHKNPSAEKIIQQGHHLLFRSLSPDSTEGQLGDNQQRALSVPSLSLDAAIEDQQRKEPNDEGEEKAFVMVQEVVEGPISSSLLLHEDGSLSIKLKCVGSGRTVYQVNVSGGE
jgi:hypothetical protein